MIHNKITIIAVMEILMFLFPAISQANDTVSARWWTMPKMTAQLNLSDAEKGRLENLYTEKRRHMIDLKAAVEKEQVVIDDIMEIEPLNESKLMEQYHGLEKARAALAEERFRYFVEVRKIIGGERFHKLKLMGEAVRKNFRHGRINAGPMK